VRGLGVLSRALLSYVAPVSPGRRMSGEPILTILPPELLDDVEELIPAILPPEEVFEVGSKAED